MKNTFGNVLCVTLFGESHGEAIGATLDGIAPGIPLPIEEIEKQMQRRKGEDALSTSRREGDAVTFISGVYRGKTTGTPLTVLIKNENQRPCDYAENPLLRPGHADLTAEYKYHGYQDGRGGGHFSGRLTAPLVALGTVCREALRAKNVTVGTHISRLYGITDTPFSSSPEKEIALLATRSFPVLNEEKGKEMKRAILAAKEAGDSVGGILETAVCGLPAGVGEPFFDTLEGTLSHALFAIPAVKGVEFGEGFSVADLLGSQNNDPFGVKDGKVVSLTNRAGGILGGISTGAPLLFRTAVKPTPSIYLPEQSASFNGQEGILQIKGRHDPAIVHRASPVVDAVCALVLADMLTLRFGTDWLGG